MARYNYTKNTNYIYDNPNYGTPLSEEFFDAYARYTGGWVPAGLPGVPASPDPEAKNRASWSWGTGAVGMGSDNVTGSYAGVSGPLMNSYAGVGLYDYGNERKYFNNFISPVTSAMPGIAKRLSGEKADPSDVAAYQQYQSQLDDWNHGYGIALGYGIGDEAATQVLRLSNDTIKAYGNELTAGTAAPLKDVLIRYNATQAKQRGYMPENMRNEENELTSHFIGMLDVYNHQSKKRAGDTISSDYLKSVTGGRIMSAIRMKQALADYESSHGLYDLQTRKEVLGKAAELLTTVMNNPALQNRYGSNYQAIMDMAVKKVIERDNSDNIIDQINGDILSINDMVTYSGSGASDASYEFSVQDKAGNIYTTAFKPVVEKALQDQAVEDRLNGVERFSNREALKQKLISNISRRYSYAAAGFSKADQDLVWGSMADELIRQVHEDGRVNLSKLGDLWLKGNKGETIMPALEQQMDWSPLSTFGTDMIQKYVGDRPGWYGWSEFWSNKDENQRMTYTDFDIIRKNVRSELAERLKGYKGKGLEKANADVINAYADEIAKEIHYANTVGDPKELSGDELQGYKDAANMLFTAATMTAKLSALGFKDVPVFKFGEKGKATEWRTDGDSGYYYQRQNRAYHNAFGQLKAYLNNYVKSVHDPDSLSDPEYVRYQHALSYLNGLETAGKYYDRSGKFKGDEESVFKKNMTNFLGFSIGDPGGAYPFEIDPETRQQRQVDSTPIEVIAAWEARQALRQSQAREVANPANINARRMLDRVLKAGFSDRTNPTEEKRVNQIALNLAAKYIPDYKPSSSQYRSAIECLRQGVSLAMQDIGQVVGQMTPDGQPYLGWDPLATTMNDTELSGSIEASIAPLLKKLKAQNDTWRDRQQSLAIAAAVEKAKEMKTVNES